MGRILKVVKHGNSKWGKDAECIAQSFVTNSLMKNVKYGLSKRVYPEEIRFNALSLGGLHVLGTTKFIGVGGQFGCREGLTRDMQRQNNMMTPKNSILVVRNKMPVQQVTYREMFTDGWTGFLEDFLSHIDVSKKLVEIFGIYQGRPGMISFPVTLKQNSTLNTVASTLILLARNSSVFCRNRGNKGLRNYKEVIEELVDDQLKKYDSRRKTGRVGTLKYARNSANFVLWNLLYYFDLMPIISRNWGTNLPNGPESYVAYGTRRIANSITNLNENNREEFFAMIGGRDSPIIKALPSSISLAVRNIATEKIKEK